MSRRASLAPRVVDRGGERRHGVGRSGRWPPVGDERRPHSAVFFVLVFALVLATSAVGGLVASRQPANPIGWIFCGFSAFRALSALAAGYAEVAPDDAATGLGQIAAWFFNWSFVVALRPRRPRAPALP